jgi:ABC-type lipoprotein release transport system permease subunit
MMTLKLAWRNVLRNKRRTLIASSAMAVGLAGLVFCDALMLGMKENMVRTVTASYLGDGQIHDDAYRATRAVEQTIQNCTAVSTQLSTDPRIAHYAPRVMSPSMARSTANLTSVMLVGVDPLREPHLSQIDDTIMAGSFFAGNSQQDVVLGWELADLLEVDIGDRLVATVAQAETGDLAQELFRVSGIYKFNSRELDSGMALIRIDKARSMLGLPADAAHEIALALADPAVAADNEDPFWREYSTAGNEALGWSRLVPQLSAVFEYSDLSLAILGIIIFGVVALGIVNALFMSIYERIFEFGVLRAIGTRSGGVWKLVLCEAGALAAISIAMGIVLSLLVHSILVRTGIDYRGIEMVGMTIRELIYPVMTARQYWFYPLWVVIFTLVIGVYPACHAARIAPAEALRKSL